MNAEYGIDDCPAIGWDKVYFVFESFFVAFFLLKNSFFRDFTDFYFLRFSSKYTISTHISDRRRVHYSIQIFPNKRKWMANNIRCTDILYFFLLIAATSNISTCMCVHLYKLISTINAWTQSAKMPRNLFVFSNKTSCIVGAVATATKRECEGVKKPTITRLFPSPSLLLVYFFYLHNTHTICLGHNIIL